jgi:thiamine biosynthesis lipoprotein
MMKMLACLAALGLAVAPPVEPVETPPPAAESTDTRPLQRFEFSRKLMGMPFVISVYAPEEALANRASAAAFARIKQLNMVFSDWEPESELMLACRSASLGQPVPISRDLLTVLRTAQDLSQRTDGAFDVSVGPLIRLWRKSRRNGKLPPPDELAAARELVNHRGIALDAEASTLSLHKPGMQIDLGGIAVGYAVDEAIKVLREQGLSRVMVDGSGDIGVGDPPPGKRGWRIGIAPADKPDGEPTVYLSLANAAVTTSGDAFQFVEIEGVRYSHIVDPRTGLGLIRRCSATVIAPNCTTADAWATAVCILGEEKGMQLIADTPQAACIFVRAVDEGHGQGERAVTVTSPRLSMYLDSSPRGAEK